MPVTEKTYPEWVQVHRKKGTTVKKKEMLTTYISGHPNEYREKNIHSL